MTDRLILPVEWEPPRDEEASDRTYAEATVSGERWRVRMNDFPEDEYLYTLFVDGAERESFQEWPPCWTRPVASGFPRCGVVHWGMPRRRHRTAGKRI